MVERLNDGSCIRLRLECLNQAWSYDFVMDMTHDGRPFRMPNIIDEFTQENLTIKAKRNLRSEDIPECLAGLFCTKGIPKYTGSDNGSEVGDKSDIPSAK